jgi:CheY-like chemotaxis protein
MMPLRVLVVEDELAVALLIEDAVESLGHIVVHTATNIKDAMAAATAGNFDVALLDLNLNGQKAHALPVTLSAQGKPFGFITGYGRAGVLEPFNETPLIAKPFRDKDIGEMLQTLQRRI